MTAAAAAPAQNPAVPAAELRAGLRGTVLEPADPGYEQARGVWNAAVDHRPAVVARCADRDDVARAVGIARRYGLGLSVRSGGHDWAGRAVRDGGLVVDLTRMSDVDVADGPDRDAAATAWIQGGVRAGGLVAAAGAHGLVPVTGTVGAVGVVGLTLGGGYGLLNGRYGLALDNLLEARVVLADGTPVRAREDENPDLLWALRGGGGNFGVVTDARYRLHAPGRLVSGLLLYGLPDARDVLRRHRDMLAGLPDELTVMAGFVSGPDGTPLMFLLPLLAGEPAGYPALLNRLEGLSSPVAGSLSEMSYAEVIGISDPSVVDGRHSDVRTRWLPALTDDVIDTLVAAGESVTSPYSAVFVHHMHGAATRVPVGATAFANRREHVLVEIVATWAAPADGTANGTESTGGADGGERHRRWASALSGELAAGELPGGYVNLLGPAEDARVMAGYGPNGPRLLRAKRTYDPDGVFRAAGAVAGPGSGP